MSAKQKPDGYTVFVHAGSAIAAAMWLFKRPPFADAGKAIQIAGTINRQPFMLVVDAKSPYKTTAELTEAMKKKGDKATYASAAPTGTVMGELYKVATGVKAVEVNYKNAVDSLNDQLSGAVDYGMHDPVYSLAQQREGRLRILGSEYRPAPRGNARSADHDGAGRPDGPHRLVGRDGPARHAEGRSSTRSTNGSSRSSVLRRPRRSSTSSAAIP